MAVGGFRRFLAGAAASALVAWAVISPTSAASRSADIGLIFRAIYCDNSACEPVTLQVQSGDRFVMSRWGDHHERIRIANIDAPDCRARCLSGRASAQQARARLAELLYGSRFTTARIDTDRRGNTVAMVTVNRRDVGHALIRERLVWPMEKRHHSWC